MRLFSALALLLSVSNMAVWADDVRPEVQKVEKKEAQIILRMHMSSGWGVSGDHRKGIQILEDGKVQCTKLDGQEVVVYAELKPLSASLVKKLKETTSKLANEKYQGTYNCADDVRQVYDNGKTGEENITFADLATYEDCSSRRVEAPKSHYLEGFLDGLYFQCPELSEKE